MSFDPNQFVVRRPRHSATGSSPGQVLLETLSENPSDPQEVRLLDLSREGAKLELSSPVPPKAEVVLHVQDDSLGLAVALRGRVRWQRAQGVGRWDLGCLFDEPVAYEVIGELFLSGVLSTGSQTE